MENDNMIMGASDVCTLLKIKESTLRKYALLLQNAGYHFDMNDKGQRAYYNKDVIALKKLLETKNSPNMTLEQSVSAVMTWLEQSGMTVPATVNKRYNEQHNDDVKELKEMIKKQNSLILELAKKMDQQQKYIDEKLEERDRRMMESIRASQEVKQQLLQLAAAQEEEKKKGFFARLFGK